jgi:hypothetical protein
VVVGHADSLVAILCEVAHRVLQRQWYTFGARD